MKVCDVMTPHAECTTSTSTLRDAATKMRNLDIGSLPVCDNGRLSGMITDRDIAIRAVAEGADPDESCVCDVMTPEVCYCFEDQSVKEAADIMAKHQVRRLPVLDREKKLVGIVALGDLATETANDHMKGDTLEAISEPNYRHGVRGTSSGPTHRGAFPWRARTFARQATPDMSMIAGIGIGAGLMYLLDPTVGRRRRKLLGDKMVRSMHETQNALDTTWRDARNRARGVQATATGMWREDHPSDRKLHDRVRSKLGRYCSHPRAVMVYVDEGHVSLEGDLLEHEECGLISAIKSLRGVKSVENHLNLHQEADISALQGGRERTGASWDVLQENWSPTTRAISCLVGTALLGTSLTQKLPTACALGSLGAGLCLASVGKGRLGSSLSLAQEQFRHRQSDWRERPGNLSAEEETGAPEQELMGSGAGQFPSM